MSMSQQEIQAEERAIAEAKNWVAKMKPWVVIYLYDELHKDPATKSLDFTFKAKNGIEVNIKGYIETWGKRLEDMALANGEPIPDLVDVLRKWAEGLSDWQLNTLAGIPDPQFWITKHTSVSCGITVRDVRERRRLAAERASREINDSWGGFS